MKRGEGKGIEKWMGQKMGKRRGVERREGRRVRRNFEHINPCTASRHRVAMFERQTDLLLSAWKIVAIVPPDGELEISSKKFTSDKLSP